MNILKILSMVSVGLLSNIASASFVATNNGFIDSAHNLEWLAPSKVTSLADYNAYVADGWQVATLTNLEQITANFFVSNNLNYSTFDQSIFDGFQSMANTSNEACQGVTFFCSSGWYHNVGTNGADYKYEIGFIGLISNPQQADPNFVEQNQLDLASTFAMSTVGSYDLYGAHNNDFYNTFMVRPVPLANTAWLFMSGLIGLTGAARKRALIRR